jgi:hypothetical protein
VWVAERESMPSFSRIAATFLEAVARASKGVAAWCTSRLS